MGTRPATQAHAPTGNQTLLPLVHNPRSIHSATPPESIILLRELPYIVFYITLGLGKEGEKLLNSFEFFKG